MTKYNMCVIVYCHRDTGEWVVDAIVGRRNVALQLLAQGFRVEMKNFIPGHYHYEVGLIQSKERCVV